MTPAVAADAPLVFLGRIERIKGVEKKKQKQEGIRMAVETIQKLREIEGIRGVHIMAIEWEEAVPQIVEMAGLLPRP